MNTWSLKKHQPDNGDHHENDSKNTDADEDDITQVVRLGFWVSRKAAVVTVRLLGLLLQASLLRRNDGHCGYLPQGITLHLVFLHVLLLPIREIDVELVYEHGDVSVLLQGINMNRVKKKNGSNNKQVRAGYLACSTAVDKLSQYFVGG